MYVYKVVSFLQEIFRSRPHSDLVSPAVAAKVEEVDGYNFSICFSEKKILVHTLLVKGNEFSTIIKDDKKCLVIEVYYEDS